ncbi:MAG: hypothetical protein ABW049_04665 [Spongiibacteraceae bacterium]
MSAIAALAATPAHAHGPFGSAAPFWSGVFHFAVAPLAIVVSIAFTAAIARADDHTVLAAIGIAAATAFGAALWMPSQWIAPAPLAAIASGLLALSGWRGRRWLYCLLAALAGSAIGIVAEPDQRTWGAAFGISGVVMLISSAGVELFLWFDRQLRWQAAALVAQRILGAWVVAIGLLLGALALFVGS